MPPWETYVSEGDALLADGCSHPLVVGYAAHLDLLRGRLGRSRERHRQASPRLLAGEFGPTARVYEAIHLMQLQHQWGLNGGRYASERLAAEALIDWAASEKDHPQKQRWLWREFNDFIGDSWQFEWAIDFTSRASQDGRLNPWLREMLAGRALYKRAWHVFHGSEKSESKKDRRKLLHQTIAEAGDHFTAAHDMEPNFPEAASWMISVSMNSAEADDDAARYWFEKARLAQVDYLSAYKKLLRTATPRYGGSLEAMYSLADLWHREGLFDTNAPYMTVKTLLEIGDEMDSRRQALVDEKPYDLAMSALQSMADDPAHSASVRDSYNRATLLTHQIGIATLTGRDRDALAVYLQLTDDGLAINHRIMDYYGLTAELNLPRMFARTGPASEFVKDVGSRERPASLGERRDRLAAYKQAREQTDLSAANPYFDYWIGVYQRELDFIAGDWVPMHFDESFSEWSTSRRGIWDVESKTSIVSRQSHTSSKPRLWSECYLDWPFEIEVEIEPIFEAGSSAWSGIRVSGEKHGYNFWLNQTRPSAGISRRAECIAAGSLPKKSSYTMTAQVWPGFLRLLVDGKKVYFEHDSEFTPNGFFALGSVPKAGHGAEVRYRNVRFRKLAPEPVFDLKEKEAKEKSQEKEAESQKSK